MVELDWKNVPPRKLFLLWLDGIACFRDVVNHYGAKTKAVEDFKKMLCGKYKFDGGGNESEMAER